MLNGHAPVHPCLKLWVLLSTPQSVGEQADFVPACSQVKALEAAEAARRKEAARAADKAKQKAEKARRADAAKVSCRRQ